MASDEIVNPMLSSSNKRWQVFQFLGPVFGVALVIGAITLVTVYSYRTTRESAILLSNNLLKSQQRYITQEVINYLSPAMYSSVVAHDVLNRETSEQNEAAFMLLGRSILRNVAQVDSFYLADEDGHFLMMARREGQYEETTLRTEKGVPVYWHNIVDQDGRFLRTDFLSAEGYDPRKQLWYTGAVPLADRVGKDCLYWTDPYPYLSTHQFIVTASVAFRTLTGRRVVFAINISLNQMTKFVNSLKVGKNGQAVIVDLYGHVIAGHNMASIGSPDFDAANIHLDPVTQPVFTRALNVFRVRGDGTGLVYAGGKNYVTIASAMFLVKRSWVLLLNAPEDDFVSFAHVVHEQTISFSLMIVSLVSVLVVAVIYQGRRASRYQKRLSVDEEKTRRESAALLRIANTSGLLNVHHDIPVITEVLAECAQAKRASIWRLLPDSERLLCEDMFDNTRDLHGSGIELTRMAHPDLFDVLSETHSVDILDAMQDARFQGIQRVVMRSVNARHLYFSPIVEQHRPVGAIMLEDPLHNEGIDRAIALVSSVMAVRFLQSLKENNMPDVSVDESDQAVCGSHPAAVSLPRRNLRDCEGFLLGPSIEGEPLVAGLYKHVPVMVLEFSEAYTAESSAARHVLGLIQELVEKLQKIAREVGLFSMQVAGSRVIFLGNCVKTPDPGSALRLADAAITMREICLMAIAGISTRLMFRIGFDVGPVLAAHLGETPSVFNIWGEALSVAELLARSAPDEGQIQVSEQAYQELKNHFLFRLRGDFYFPGSGVTSNYILAGRR